MILRKRKETSNSRKEENYEMGETRLLNRVLCSEARSGPFLQSNTFMLDYGIFAPISS